MEHKDDKLPGCLKNDPPPPPSSRKCPQATAQAAIKSWVDRTLPVQAADVLQEKANQDKEISTMLAEVARLGCK